MKYVWLIRHGQTDGNKEKRYIGITDEPLNAAGRRQAVALRRIQADEIYISPLSRCVQTAELAFPDMDLIICTSLAECSFGIFEGKSADELAEATAYRQWVEGGCLSPIPGGESVCSFKERCCTAFIDAVRSSASDRLAFVMHGGCIMAILERFEGSRSFYDYHIDNGCAVLCAMLDDDRLRIIGGIPC